MNIIFYELYSLKKFYVSILTILQDNINYNRSEYNFLTSLLKETFNLILTRKLVG